MTPRLDALLRRFNERAASHYTEQKRETAWILQTWKRDPENQYSWLVNTRLFTSKAAALLWVHENLSGAKTPAKWDLWLQRYIK